MSFNGLKVDISNVVSEVKNLIDNYEFDKALNLIFGFIDMFNQDVQEKKIWETGNKKELYELAIGIRLVTNLLWSFIIAVIPDCTTF